jgi:hydroxyacylglutathione hydrolase
MKVSELIVETLPVGQLQCNFTILGDPVSRKAIVVDPRGDAEMLIEPLVKLDLLVKLIIHTHAHLDHFLASAKLK